MSTAICNLNRIGWSTCSPNKWKDPFGQTWENAHDTRKLNHHSLNEALGKSVLKTLLQKASSHRHGQGLQNGVDLLVHKKHLAKLAADGNYKARGLLLAAATGGLWPNARVHEAYPEVSQECDLCGGPIQDEAHLGL